MDVMEILFIMFILFYWIGEGVTEGYTWASREQRDKNKIIHRNGHHNGIMDYHGWRVVEQIGIWGAIFVSYFYTLSFWNWFIVGVGAWLIGAAIYDMVLNYIDKGTLYKPTTFKWYILGFEIPMGFGEGIWILFGMGIIILAIGIII